MSRCTLIHGDCLDVLRQLGDASVDSIVTDPPAGIGFMGREWDSDRGGRNQWIAWLASVMREALRVLKPGGHALVWALPRTSHWTATAIEDAGFDIRDVHHHIFGCVPLETEILTERGWVAYDQLAIGESVVQVDERGRASLGSIERVSVYPFEGEMCRIATRSTEQVLTPGHKMHAYARRNKWKRTDTDETMTMLDAEDMVGADRDGVAGWQLPLGARGADVRRSLESADVASLYGWVITEGNFQRDTRAVNLYQNEGPKADEIRALLRRLDVPHSEYLRTRDDYDGTPRENVQWYIKVGPWAERLLADLAGDKPTPPEWLAWLPEEQAHALFESLIDGDGSRNDGDASGAWYQKRPEVRAWFQSLCFRLGYRSTDNVSKSAVQWSRTDSTEVQRGSHRQRWASRVPYAGEVWCPTVPQGRWVARYRGNVFVTGNTGFPKSLTPKSSRIPRGTGTALKPAVEHWILARKPLEGTVAENLATHGTGTLNIEACRIGTDIAGWGGGGRGADDAGTFNEATCGLRNGAPRPVAGRWPAHLSLDEHGAAALDEQSGERKSGSRAAGVRKGIGYNSSAQGDGGPAIEASTGGASRYFYVAKPSRSERDSGLDDLAATTGGEATGRKDGAAGTRNPRAGAGRTGGAKNIHPTVKSIALMRWLVRLVTPPGGLVLDMFTGSGSTGLACAEEGMCFLGIEREPSQPGAPDYHGIALRRLRKAYGSVETRLPEQRALDALLTPRRPVDDSIGTGRGAVDEVVIVGGVT